VPASGANLHSLARFRRGQRSEDRGYKRPQRLDAVCLCSQRDYGDARRHLLITRKVLVNGQDRVIALRGAAQKFTVLDA